MKKWINKFLLTIFTVMFSFSLYAQDAASVEWTCAAPDSQEVSSISGAVEGFPEIGGRNFNVYSYSDVSNGGGLGLPAQRWCPYDGTTRFTWGGQTGPVDTQYVEFAMKPLTGFSFNTDSVSIYLGASGTTDHINARIVYSVGSDFTSNTVLGDSAFLPPRDLLQKYSYSLDEDLTDADTLFVRVYVWYDGSNSSSKYIFVQDAKIYGTTQSESTSAAATWALTDPGDGGTGQTVALSGPVEAFEESFRNMRINGYSGVNNSQRTDNRPSGGMTQWPSSQTTRLDSVYVQFAVTPREGTKFNAKNISLKIGANSTNYLRADILYSTDSTFSSFGKIPDSLVWGNELSQYPTYLTRDSLNPVSFDISSAVEDGEIFYVRVFPWVHDQTSGLTGKYLLLQDVVISGDVEGTIVYNPPTIATTAISNISTTFAFSGGIISSDGGAAVTMRGVVWNTTGTPTVADPKTEDGEGTGTFSSSIEGLIPGTTYYLRAYAENIAGVGYGNEIIFATLDSTEVPTVTTTEASTILAVMAQSGGNVTLWGGDSVIARGVCWNTTGNPTVEDSKTVNGSGLGSFSSTLYPLIESTTYYVRAYATNSKGTGYGAVDTFETQVKAENVLKIVAADGSGDYTTVQAAFDDIPDFYTGEYRIYVKNGTYYEKLLLDRNKTNVILQGQSKESTILTYDDYAGKSGVGGTSNSYSVAIDADDFTAMDITFQNTIINDQTFSDQQAVALRVNGDRQAYYNCNLLGYQDTYYAWGGRATGRTYMKGCYIEGSVDFIFGRNVVVMDSCQIHVLRNQCSITAASTNPETRFGLVFMNCLVAYDSVDFDGNVITEIDLGRAWQNEPRTVYIDCDLPSVIIPQGWNPNPINSGVVPALYGIYNSKWPGFSIFEYTSGIGSILTQGELEEHTIENIFAMESHPNFAYDWMPEEKTVVGVKKSEEDILPDKFAIAQNYPNPFNPTTTIKYDVPSKSIVNISIYDILGRLVKVLVNEQVEPGHHQIVFNASNIASGVYFYNMRTDNFTVTKKMLLLK